VTPHLDKLAAGGVRFENCYVQSPVCSPSRASLYTGKYPSNHGLHANGVPLPPGQRLFSRLLADAGYDCGMVGKHHLSPCDTWRTEPRQDDGYRVFDWAHGPNHRALENAYHRWLRTTHPDVYQQVFPDTGANENTEYSNRAFRDVINADGIPPPSTRPGQADNTLVVFTSDHGEMLGNHQQLLKGPQLYDDLTRVPLIVNWPGHVATEKVVSAPVQWIDLSATLLQAAGCAPPRGGQGESLLPLARGEVQSIRPWALCEYRDSGFPTEPATYTTMLRHGDWKLIVWHGEPACGSARDGELYNLATDPAELHNLFHDIAYRDKMKTLLLDAMESTEDRTAPRVRDW